MSDAQPVASSATPDPVDPPPSALDTAVASGDVAAFRAARLAERTGKPLEPPNPADPASAPADTSQPASTDAHDKPPASEPGARPGHKGNADTRVQELLAERADLRKRLDALERRTPPVETTPAAPSPAPAQADDDPEPQLSDYEDPYAWMRDTARWEGRQAFRQAQATERAAREAQDATTREEARIQGFREQVEAASAEDAGFVESLSDDVKGLRTIHQAKAAGEALTPRHAIAEELLDSPVAPALMRHWTDHPDEFQKLAGQPGPRELIREFGRQEGYLQAVAAAVAAHKVKPPAPSVTQAPPPPTTLGSRPAEPVDAIESAVHSGDVAAFRAAKLRERLAAIRGPQ